MIAIKWFAYSNFFTNRITNRWNGISQEIINAKTIDTLKKAYDKEQALIRRLSTTSSWFTAVNQPST